MNDNELPDRLAAEDDQLLQRSIQRDANAYGALYERHAPAVFRYLYAHTGHRLDAEDLCEEVFLRVWRSLPDYRERGLPFQAFVFRVARNALIDHYRKGKANEQSLPLDEVSLGELEIDPNSPVSSFEQYQALHRALARLPEDYREILVLRFLSGLSSQEAAQAMKRTPAAVRVLQHRALEAMRKALEKEPE
jgi:RNA polymerase sigma-70 factor (ECF subfamily)